MTKPVSLPQLYLLVLLAFISIAPPFAALAQTNAPAPLPSAAQEALNKGILAAKVPDYPLAIRFFEEARKLAPQAPVIFMNLGVAESKMPGRELRAIAWFGAYLAAAPDAPNAAAVKEQIAVLEVRNRSNVSRLIKTVQLARKGPSILFRTRIIKTEYRGLSLLLGQSIVLQMPPGQPQIPNPQSGLRLRFPGGSQNWAPMTGATFIPAI